MSHAAHGSCYVMRTLHPVSLSAQLSLSREQFTMPSQHSSGGCVVTSQIDSQSGAQRRSATLRRELPYCACTPRGGLPPYMSGWGWECGGAVCWKWLVEKSTFGHHLESA